MTPDEARLLPQDERKTGIVVDGNVPPFGGSWSYDPEANTLTLQETPTAETAPKQEGEKNAG